MTFGIKDPLHRGPVPGTGMLSRPGVFHIPTIWTQRKWQLIVQTVAFMSSGPDLPEEYRDIPHDFFRYGSGKYSDIILLPQPSDSPNDP